MRRRFIPFVIAGAALFVFSQLNLGPGKVAPLRVLDELWLDFCIGNAGEALELPAVTVIRIDDEYEPIRLGGETTGDEGQTLSRLDYATFFDFLADLSPRTVTFLPTPQFDEGQLLNLPDVVPLRDSAMQLPRMLIATEVTRSGKGGSESPVPYQTIKFNGEGIENLPAITQTLTSPDPQLLDNSDAAFKTIRTSEEPSTADDIRIPLVARQGDKVIPSIILTSVARHQGIAVEDIAVNFADGGNTIELGSFRSIPINADGSFTLPAHTGIDQSLASRERNQGDELTEKWHFTSLTVDELSYTGGTNDEVANRIVGDLRYRFDSVRQNLIMIGFDRLADRTIATSSGELISETMAIAKATAVIQSGRFIQQWPGWARIVAALILIGIAAVLFLLPRRKLVRWWLVASVFSLGAMVVIFQTTLSWTPPFFAFGLLGLVLVIGLLLNSQRSEQQG